MTVIIVISTGSRKFNCLDIDVKIKSELIKIKYINLNSYVWITWMYTVSIYGNSTCSHAREFVL